MQWLWIGRRARRLHRCDAGQDLIEYAMLAALIALAALVAVDSLAAVIKTQFWDVAAHLF